MSCERSINVININPRVGLVVNLVATSSCSENALSEQPDFPKGITLAVISANVPFVHAHTRRWSYNDNSILFLNMGATDELRRRSMVGETLTQVAISN